jgi:hypothetical protein
MINKKQRKRMMSFHADLLQKNKNIKLTETEEDHILFEGVNTGNKGYILLHNKKITEKEFDQKIRELAQKQIPLLNIFYKDDETFHKRLAFSGYLKNIDYSLRKYDLETVNKMIHLRLLEKKVLEFQRNNTLAYYQPETKRLEESIRLYEMQIVKLDYEYMADWDPRKEYAERNEYSIDYKIAEELGAILKRESIKLIRTGKNIIINPESAKSSANKIIIPRKTTLF